nr:MAG TPA: hypothetical protein [Caudoviricetes sp.]
MKYCFIVVSFLSEQGQRDTTKRPMHAMYTGLFRLKVGTKSHGGNTEVPILLVQFVSSCVPAASDGHLKALRNL